MSFASASSSTLPQTRIQAAVQIIIRSHQRLQNRNYMAYPKRHPEEVVAMVAQTQQSLLLGLSALGTGIPLRFVRGMHRPTGAPNLVFANDV